ncbi:MAG: hypothetical protein U0228_25985 [Myxococcaceae bacterium]
MNVVAEAPLRARLTSGARRSDTLEHVISTLPASVREVVRLFDGRRSIADAVRDSPLPRHLTLDIIGRLQLLGVLERDEKKSKRRSKRRAVGSQEAITLPLALEGTTDDTLRSTESEAFSAEVRALRERMRREEREALEVARESASVPWPVTGSSSPTPVPTLVERPVRFSSSPTPVPTLVERPVRFSSSPTPAPTLVERPTDEASPLTPTLSPSGGEGEEFAISLARQRTRRNRVLAVAGALAAVLLAVVLWPDAAAPEAVVPAESGWLPVDALPASLSDAWAWNPATVHPPRKPSEDFVIDVSPRLVRAQRLADQGRLREASDLLDEAVALAPGNFEAWLLRAGVRFDLGDRAHARGSAERAEELMPNDVRVQLLFATLALDQGDAEAARTALFKVLAVDPDGQEGVEAKALLERLDRRGLPRVQ